jgi:hypothetical protein
MTRTRPAAFAVASLSLVVAACQTLPVGATVPTADGAIAIAMKHCTIDRGDADETNAANWSARLVGQAWNVTYTAPPSLTLHNIDIGTISTKVSTRDGSASSCEARMVVTAH